MANPKTKAELDGLIAEYRAYWDMYLAINHEGTAPSFDPETLTRQQREDDNSWIVESDPFETLARLKARGLTIVGAYIPFSKFEYADRTGHGKYDSGNWIIVLRSESGEYSWDHLRTIHDWNLRLGNKLYDVKVWSNDWFSRKEYYLPPGQRPESWGNYFGEQRDLEDLEKGEESEEDE